MPRCSPGSGVCTWSPAERTSLSGLPIARFFPVVIAQRPYQFLSNSRCSKDQNGRNPRYENRELHHDGRTCKCSGGKRTGVEQVRQQSRHGRMPRCDQLVIWTRRVPQVDFFLEYPGFATRPQKRGRLSQEYGDASASERRETTQQTQNTTETLVRSIVFVVEDFIHLGPRLLAARWLQIAHGALYVRVTEPILNGAQVYASPEASRRERGPELV